MVKRTLIPILMILLSVSFAIAKDETVGEISKVFAKDRNIYIVDNGKATQVTSSGRDEYPALHPKGEWIYFVRATPGNWVGEKYYPAKDEVIKDGILHGELWRIRKDGTQAKLLFRNDRCAIDGPDPDYAVASIYNIQFSPDGDKVYFETPNWVTSAALHVMKPDGSGEKLLGAGNDTKIILSARTFEDREHSYEGYIVTAQHRYFFYGGSYDWYYLFTPDMKKEVAPLGDDPAYFTEVGDIKYTDHSEKTMERSEKLNVKN